MRNSSTSILGASYRHRASQDSLRNQAFQQIREKIVSGALPPASLVDEKALAHQLKLGLTPIRQALRWLALENLVIILPRRGTIVADLNSTDLQKIFEVRLQLVPYAFRLAAQRATVTELKAIESTIAKAREVIASGTAAEMLAVDRKVQELVIEAAHNEFLLEILERLHAQAMRFWRTDRIHEGQLREQIKQHRQIMAALRAGDGERAENLIRTLIAEFHREQTQGL